MVGGRADCADRRGVGSTRSERGRAVSRQRQRRQLDARVRPVVVVVRRVREGVRRRRVRSRRSHRARGGSRAGADAVRRQVVRARRAQSGGGRGRGAAAWDGEVLARVLGRKRVHGRHGRGRRALQRGGGSRVQRQSRLQDRQARGNQRSETLLLGLLGTEDRKQKLAVAFARLAERVEDGGQASRRRGLVASAYALLAEA